MPAADATERYLVASAAAHTRWAMEPDRAAATASGRAAFERRFEDEVDPERKLNPTERARRAASARQAYFARLTLASVQARRARSRGTAA